MNNSISEYIANLFTPAGFGGFVNLLVIFMEVIYLVFAAIIVRQVHLLNKSFKTDVGIVFSLFAYLHFFMSLGLVIVSLLFA